MGWSRSSGNHLQVAIQGSREGFLEKHALSCRDQLVRGLLVQVRWRDEDCGVRQILRDQFVDGRQHGYFASDAIDELLGAFAVRLYQRRESALSFPGEFMDVKCMDPAHAATTYDS